jgi:hypothetical protein
MDTFQKITNLKELIQANVQFLKGYLNRSPYHCGPIDTETLPMLEDLVELNELGCITINSQPPIDEFYFLDSMCHQTQQKSYVEGYMLASILDEFVRFMKEYDEKYSYKIYTIHNISGIRKWIYKLINLSDIRVDLHIDHCKNISENLTRERTTKFGDDNVCAFTWRNYSNIHSEIPMPYDFENLPNMDKFMVNKMVKFIIYSNEYNEGRVEKLLLKFFKNLQ